MIFEVTNTLTKEIDEETAQAIRQARLEERVNFHVLRRRFPINRIVLAAFVRQLDEEARAVIIREIRFAWLLGDSCRTIGRTIGWDKRNVAYLVRDLSDRQFERRRCEARRKRQQRWSLKDIGQHVHWDDATVRRAVADLDSAHAQAVQYEGVVAYRNGANLATIGQQFGMAGKVVDTVIGGLHAQELARLKRELDQNPSRSLAQLARLFPRWSQTTLRKHARRLIPQVSGEKYIEPETQTVYYAPEVLAQLFGSRSRRVFQKKLRAARVHHILVYHPHHRRPIVFYAYSDAIEKLA